MDNINTVNTDAIGKPLANQTHEEYCKRRAFGKNRSNRLRCYLETYPNASYNTAKSNVYKLEKRADIQTRIRELKHVISQNWQADAIASETEVLQELTKIVRQDLTDFLSFGSRPDARLVDTIKQIIADLDAGNLTGHKKSALVQLLIDVINETKGGPDIPYIRVKDSATVDGSALQSITQTRDGLRIQLPDKLRALSELLTYYDRQRKDDLPDTGRDLDAETINKMSQALEQQIALTAGLLADKVNDAKNSDITGSEASQNSALDR